MLPIVLGGLLVIAVEHFVRATPNGPTRDTLSFGGTLMQNGKPLTGAQSLTFTFKTAKGTICAPQSTVTPDSGTGAFNAQIDVSSCPGAALFDGSDVTVDVSVGGNLIAANQPINPVPYAKYADNGVPAGTVLSFAGQGVPAGWLPCDGAPYSRTGKYAGLFAAIGTSWGAPDGTTFNVPDLRGRFLRGQDQGAGNDPDATSRSASKAGGAVGDAVGTAEDQATRKNGLSATTDTQGSHSHGLAGGTRNFLGGIQVVVVGAGGVAGALNAAGAYSATDPAGGHAHSVTLVDGDKETRPKNVSVNYIIKY
jgi:microcystin-dependent protein